MVVSTSNLVETFIVRYATRDTLSGSVVANRQIGVRDFKYLGKICPVRIGHVRYGDGAGNTVEENSSVFSLIRMR